MIEADGLTMHYGPVVALEKASFTVEPGEVVGLLGPNGAGKSTCMKILTTFLHPNAGRARVAGHDVLLEPLEVRRKVGYLPEAVPLYLDMEVRDYLRFVGAARGIERGALNARLDWALDACALRSMLRRPIRELSKGYRQRTALAQALIHDPEVIILDEPTSGLDPHQIIEVRRLVRELAQTKTVILSTHILHEASMASDRLLVIDRGRIVGNGTVEDLRRTYARRNKRTRATVALAGQRETFETELAGLGKDAEVTFERVVGRYVHFTLETGGDEPAVRLIGALAAKQGWELGELADRPPTLEEIFLALAAPDHVAAGTDNAEGTGQPREEGAA
jgi:ABC-2 type transport system ATP-binding protein